MHGNLHESVHAGQRYVPPTGERDPPQLCVTARRDGSYGQA